MKTLDLNCDMGELPEGKDRNYDAEIMPYISSCNIACGFHSGTPLIMEQTIHSAIQQGVRIGAHPSYNDRENFGRVSIQVPIATFLADLRYQIVAIKGMVESFGQRLHHVKPHGALYNDLLLDLPLADQFVQLVKSIDPQLKIMTLAHSGVIDCCEKHGMSVIHEGFADRRYETRTQLRSRTYDDAVLHQPQDVLRQIDGFLNNKVQLANGEWAAVQLDSICLHSDTQGAVALSKNIHRHLSDNGIQIKGLA